MKIIIAALIMVSVLLGGFLPALHADAHARLAAHEASHDYLNGHAAHDEDASHQSGDEGSVDNEAFHDALHHTFADAFVNLTTVGGKIILKRKPMAHFSNNAMSNPVSVPYQPPRNA